MRRVWPDVVLVAACTLAQLSSVQPGNAGRPGALAGALALVAALVGGLLLWWRRRAALEVLVGAAAAYAVQAAAVGPIAPVAVGVACYSAGRYGPGVWGPVAGLFAVVVVAASVTLVGWTDLAPTYAVPLVVAVLAGVLVLGREHRAEAVTRSAVVAERLRIARDLHDVVGHGVGAITVQAGAGRMALAAGADAEVRRALLSIEQAGRGVLREVRWLVGVLRERPDEVTERDLIGLAAAARGAGFEVDMTIAGNLHTVPSEMAQIVYRIVQEGLTNAFKHSGAERVQVRVDITERVVVTVLDGGVGGPAADGFGIRGMRERAAAVGGTVSAGPRSDAPGWQLQATLPVRAGTAGRRTARSRWHHSRLA
jgi:signal transduction histidine kinase